MCSPNCAGVISRFHKTVSCDKYLKSIAPLEALKIQAPKGVVVLILLTKAFKASGYKVWDDLPICQACFDTFIKSAPAITTYPNA